MINTTIAAISTGMTEAGISVIRISGDAAVPIAEKVFRSVSGRKLADMSGYTCTLGKVISNKCTIDECIATVFRAPRSYTGEDVVELSCHGGIVISRDILRAVLDAGASPAEPGEFTKRAFLNGKMDLIEAESVMNLISAKNSGEAQAALAVKEGHVSKKINDVKNDLLNYAAHLNAWADYPEEDIPALKRENLLRGLLDNSHKLSSLLSRYDNGKLFSGGIDTVIIGKPNVGKSTLMNRLIGSDRSIVTSVPGTTRDTVEEQIQIGSYKLNLIDTAGIHDTDDEVEKIGVERAQKKLERAKLVFFVTDASRPLDEEDFGIYKLIPEQVPTIIIFNKADLILTGTEDDVYEEIDEAYDTLTNSHHVLQYTRFIVSLKDEEFESYVTEKMDVNRLETLMERFFLGKDGDYAEDVISYNERQRSLIDKAKTALDEAIHALNRGETLDAVTVLIEETVGYLTELTGERVTDEVVDRVFHNFCVGK